MKSIHIPVSLWVQISFIILCLFCFIAYFSSYHFGKKYAQNDGPPFIRKFLKFCYCGIGSLIYISWITMNFLPQPRFSNLLHVVFMGQPVEWFGLAMSLYGLAILIYFSRWFGESYIANWAVARSDYDYLKPKKLLTTGRYGIVRHPMVIGVIFQIFGLALFLGSYYTLLLWPIYFMLNNTMNTIQEKYVLVPEFGNEYLTYMKTTPRILTWWSSIILLVGLVLAVLATINVPLG